MAEIAYAIGKVWVPTALFYGLISITDAKEMTLIVGAIVTMTCTVLVTVSTINRNKRE